jgi:Rab GDP dissociation inhibitor
MVNKHTILTLKDIFVMMVSSVHNVCKKGFNIAIVSTNVETNNPIKELDPAFEILGPVIEKFPTVHDKITNLSGF